MNLIKSNGRDSFRSWNSDEMFNELANNNHLIGLSFTASDGVGSAEEGLKVTRRIMIVKSPITQSGSPPVSPAGSTPPVSPFAGKPNMHFCVEMTEMAFRDSWTLGILNQ